MRTIAELLVQGEAALRSHSLSPRLDSTLLLSHSTGLSKIELISKSKEIPPREVQAEYLSRIGRRVKGEPVAYILGKKEFFGREFKVSSSVLIPRPDTELLVEKALLHIQSAPSNTPLKILELGVGSGCVVTTIAAECKGIGRSVEIVGVDISPEALGVATENAKLHGVYEAINFIQGSWFSPLSKEQLFSIIVSNPPYIARNDEDVSPETRFEPQDALYGGQDGLDAYRAIAAEFSHFLVPGGALLLEMGHSQAGCLSRIFAPYAPKSSPKIFKDLAGRDRVFQLTQHA